MLNMKYSIGLLALVHNQFSSTTEIIMTLLQISWQNINRQQGQQSLYKTQLLMGRVLVNFTPSGKSLLSSSMTVSSSSQQMSTVGDREICSPGCPARVIDWTW